jgi:hypothetical protein
MSPLLMMAEGGGASAADVTAAFQAAGISNPTASQVSYFTGMPNAASAIANAVAITNASNAMASGQSGATSTSGTVSTSGGGGGGGGGSSVSASANQSVLDSIKQIYAEQLGRTPDDAGLKFYADQLASGAKTPQQVAAELDRSTEGYNYDVQNVTSAYRQNFGRNPDQSGLQYYMGKEDADLSLATDFANLIKGGASGADVEAIKNNPQGFLSFISEALRADPYGGGYAVDNPYIFDAAVAQGRPNVSQTEAGQYIQFVNPITERPSYSGFTPDGSMKVFAGNDVLQPDRVRQAVNLATQSGALTQADASRILTAISSPEKFREITNNPDPTANTLYALLADPKASVMVNALGIQVGEDADASLAMAETAARQKIVDRAREQTGFDVNPSTLKQADVAKELGIKFPFTQENLTIDPATGQPIRTMMTAEDVYNNLFTQLNIPTDKELKNVFTSGLGFYTPGGTGVSSPAAVTTPAVTGTSGDFRGLAFPQERPTTIGETPAMLGFQPYVLTQPGSGQQKTTEPKPVIPVSSATADPVTGALLGSAIASMLPGSQSNVLSGLGDVVSGVGSLVNTGAKAVKNIFSKDGGMATPLMKEGGMVQNFADGGFSQITSGLGDIFGSTPVRGALFGALISNLLNAQARSQAQGAYRGIDMSKVGVIPPRTTQVGPARFAPYRQYASAPEVPQSVSSPINIGALTASQTPMTSFTPTTSMTNPLARPLNQVMPTPMADGGAAYYTYGQQVDPMQYLQGMAQGGMAHGGLNEVHHADNAPLVQGRKDYRAGSAVTGPGDGQSDDIPAMLADGEYVFDADTVAQLGNGSTKAGSKILDKFREELRAHKRSAPVNKIPPPAKSPLAYLAAAQKKGARRG